MMRRSGILKLVGTIMAALLTAPAAAQTPKAVVMEERNEVNVYSETGFTWTLHREVLIADPADKEHTHFSIFLNKDMELAKFQITLSTPDGRILRTLKQKDLVNTELSEGLASDGRISYVSFIPTTTPTLAVVDMKVDFKRDNLSLPAFSPLDSYDTEVRHAQYELTCPKDFALDYQAVNTSCQPRETLSGKTRKLVFELSDLKAVANSSYSRSLSETAPKVYFRPRTISYYKTRGSMATWQEMGQWLYSLTTGLDALPQEAVDKVKALTENCATDKEKVAALYRHLAATTRYVSIQLGIGGYRPMPAADVWRLGYGDCKALSNYMKALLKAAGIESHCAAISTREERLLKDFPNFQQMDHMILEVPLQDDTLWIECTHPSLPLGYVHSAIAGHDALVLTPGGGRIATLPQYADTASKHVTSATITLAADGTADIAIDDTYTGHLYDRYSPLAKASQKDLKEFMLARYNLPQAQVTAATAEDQCEDFQLPQTTTRLKAHSGHYANATGSRLFLPSTPLRNTFSPGADSHLAAELFIRKGMLTKEHITIHLPDGYEVEAMPESCERETPYLHFRYTAAQDGKDIVITSETTLRHGLFPQAQDEMFELEKMMASVYAKKITLKKKN